MRRYGFKRLAVWPAIAAVAFALFLTALFVLGHSGTNHRYAEIPELGIRVGLPPSYEYCASPEPSPAFYLICDDRRERDLAASPESQGQHAARYSISMFDAGASLSLGYSPANGIESARNGISDAFFAVPSLNGTNLTTDPSLEVTLTAVDGHDALEFVAPGGSSASGEQPQRHLLVIGLHDGRLVEVFNQPDSPISAATDAANFREIVRGIKFRRSS